MALRRFNSCLVLTLALLCLPVQGKDAVFISDSCSSCFSEKERKRFPYFSEVSKEDLRNFVKKALERIAVENDARTKLPDVGISDGSVEMILGSGSFKNEEMAEAMVYLLVKSMESPPPSTYALRRVLKGMSYPANLEAQIREIVQAINSEKEPS